MNLNQGASVAELGAILAAADDAAGDHVLWVDLAGHVYLAGPLAAGARAAWSASHAARVAVVGAIFPAGGGGVGPRTGAVAVARLLAALDGAWAAYTHPRRADARACSG